MAELPFKMNKMQAKVRSKGREGKHPDGSSTKEARDVDYQVDMSGGETVIC